MRLSRWARVVTPRSFAGARCGEVWCRAPSGTRHQTKGSNPTHGRLEGGRERASRRSHVPRPDRSAAYHLVIAMCDMWRLPLIVLLGYGSQRVRSTAPAMGPPPAAAMATFAFSTCLAPAW